MLARTFHARRYCLMASTSAARTLAPARPRVRLRAWPLVVLGALLAVAAVTRLVNLDVYTGKFDEGIRAEQLLLMDAGFRPVRDIFAAQGPLSLDVFYGPYVLFGHTLGAARLAVALYSLVGIAAIWWVARQIGGNLAAALATALLTLSPLYLKNSRLALLEVPSLVPATLAIGAALHFASTGRRAALVASGVLIAIALSIKPMALPAAVATGLIVLLRKPFSWRDVALFGLVTALVGLAVAAVYGLDAIVDQVVQYRLAAHRGSGWSLKENWSIARQELVDESLALYALALFGGLVAATRRPRVVAPLFIWLALSAGLLAIYSPLQFKHVVILLPPLALLAGLGLAEAVRGLERWRACRHGPAAGRADPDRGSSPGPLRASLLLVWPLTALLLVGWYAATFPRVAGAHRLILAATPETPPETYDDEAALIARLTTPDDFIVVDDPYIAYRVRRMVPPALVDTSSYRIRSGALSARATIAELERFDVRLLFLFSDGLRDLQPFSDYVDERFRAVKIYERPNGKDRALYLREDADFHRARAALFDSRRKPLNAEIAGQMRLLGYSLDRDELRPGGSAALTLYWESTAQTTVDWHVLTILRDARGREVLQRERNLGGGGEGTADWPAGRWVVRSNQLQLRNGTPSGDYSLSVALYDSKARSSPPVTAGAPPGSAPNEILLGTVRVRDRA
ncbi:MAG: glycosyltransferase family 39 protein [Chloroflexi bacterium]|nr:glycosyltransferase family 39 protein [Chloroflexota bacterium]